MPREEDVVKTAEFVYKRWVESQFMQRWFRVTAATAASAAEVRLLARMAQLRNASLIVGSVELALTLGVPLAVWVGVFAAMGAPYLEARAFVTSENFPEPM